MSSGKPVAILFTKEEGIGSTLLYCELIQKARFGESFLIKNQGCSVGAYVLGEKEKSPEGYYYTSGRYRDMDAIRRAVSNLNRLVRKGTSIRITPYSGGDFDSIILFLKPERAMRLIQAYTYSSGIPVEIKTGGIASVCGDCTSGLIQGRLALSLGCKGSRKHSKYSDDELVVGIPFQIACEIDEALGKIPQTQS
jgi:uncharacterized protein (DUF169 family)